MNQFNLGNFVNNFVNYALQNANRGGAPNPANPAPPAPNMPGPGFINPAQNFQATMMNSNFLLNNYKMNSLANFEKSLYIKDLMNLPKDLEEVLVAIQNQTSSAQQATKLLSTNINMATIAELIQANGKEAMNKLVLVMSNAAKQGMTDLSQIKDAIKLINASVSVAAQDNPNQVLKSFMLLYLPWIPLQEGVDFDLEIEVNEGSVDKDATSITILISTRNFGNVKATLILQNSNSIDIIIDCSEKFPKEELLKRINGETQAHSLKSSVVFQQKDVKKTEVKEHQAKISMSNLTEVNPFMLMMANAVIRHTIDLDNQAG